MADAPTPSPVTPPVPLAPADPQATPPVVKDMTGTAQPPAAADVAAADAPKADDGVPKASDGTPLELVPTPRYSKQTEDQSLKRVAEAKAKKGEAKPEDTKPVEAAKAG